MMPGRNSFSSDVVMAGGCRQLSNNSRFQRNGYLLNGTASLLLHMVHLRPVLFGRADDQGGRDRLKREFALVRLCAALML
jgi:hypothetical protein